MSTWIWNAVLLCKFFPQFLLWQFSSVSLIVDCASMHIRAFHFAFCLNKIRRLQELKRDCDMGVLYSYKYGRCPLFWQSLHSMYYWVLHRHFISFYPQIFTIIFFFVLYWHCFVNYLFKLQFVNYGSLAPIKFKLNRLFP